MFPQKQPDLDGQPYRAFPYFNTSVVNSQQVKESRPESAVLKLVMMTMDEWPLLESWVLYHGEIIGFENLYIIDGSTNPRCISFLRYARDILGANVLFSNANLNELESLMTRVASDISGSSDFIMKVDTDEFLGIYDNATAALSVNVMGHLAGFVTNKDHPLRRLQEKGHSRVGYVQGSIPSRRVCDDNNYATPDKFPLSEVLSVNQLGIPEFKAVYSSRHKFAVNVGGHAFGDEFSGSSSFGIIHYHFRCVEIEVENCKRVLERHNYITATADKQEVRSQLAKLCNVKPEQNFCEVGCNFGGASFHKAVFYTKWLDCEESTKREYYNGEGTGQVHAHVSTVIKQSVERFSP